MQQSEMFQWVEFKQDVPDRLVKQGDRGVILDYLSPNNQQKEAGYTIEVFKDGKTLDVISIPISWVISLSMWWVKV